MFEGHIDQAVGASGRMCGGQTEGNPQVRERKGVLGPWWKLQGGGGVVLAVTVPRDEPSGGGGGVDPNKKCERRQQKRDHSCFDVADHTEQCPKEIVQYQRAEPLGRLLHR